MAINEQDKTLLGDLLALEPKLDRNVRDIQKNTPLHLSAAGGHCDGASALITAGANVNAVNESGKTPLSEALIAGRERMVDLLLNHGAKETMDKLDKKYRSAAHWRPHVEMENSLNG